MIHEMLNGLTIAFISSVGGLVIAKIVIGRLVR